MNRETIIYDFIGIKFHVRNIISFHLDNIIATMKEKNIASHTVTILRSVDSIHSFALIIYYVSNTLTLIYFESVQGLSKSCEM